LPETGRSTTCELRISLFSGKEEKNEPVRGNTSWRENMKPYAILILCLFLATIFACGGREVTPPDVEEAYFKLRSELDADSLGESIKLLEDFLEAHADYQIVAVIKQDISQLRDQVEGRFHVARELARGGELERAEKILLDLIEYFPDTDDGEMGERHLQFDFYMFKATQLMMDGDLDNAEQAVREVMTNDLTVQQTEHAENLLDGLSKARHSKAMSQVHSRRAACQRLHVNMAVYYVEYDGYPENLSIDSLDFMDSTSQRFIRKNLSAIEDYEVSKRNFSLVAVGKDGKTRFRVTQDGVETY
jgi:hypothetical protein